MFVGQMSFGHRFFYQKMRDSSFHHENVRANVIKLFLSVLYGFFVVFVRLGLKSLPGTNTLAY
jgi:hypothetical protein